MTVSLKHMDVLSRDTIDLLVEHSSQPCVSIFMPTHRRGAEKQQDPIRLKNLLKAAEQTLERHGTSAQESARILEPLHALQRDVPFWQYQGDGLALFASPDALYTYRLPMAFRELVFVNRRFYTKPLLPALSGDGRFHLLALAMGNVRLFECTRWSMEPVDLGSVEKSFPQSLEAFDFERTLQHRPGGQGGNAIFHGHGDGGDHSERKELLRNYLRHVENAVRKRVASVHGPLILAGVEYVRAMYREVNHYDGLLAEGIDGNPDQLSEPELQARAWQVAAPILSAQREEAKNRFQRFAGAHDARASSDLAAVVPAAFYRQVDTLFVPLGLRAWGEFDPTSSKVSLHPALRADSEDLLDFAAAHTLRNGGTVYAVAPEEMPGGHRIAAIQRG